MKERTDSVDEKTRVSKKEREKGEEGTTPERKEAIMRESESVVKRYRMTEV